MSWVTTPMWIRMLSDYPLSFSVGTEGGERGMKGGERRGVTGERGRGTPAAREMLERKYLSCIGRVSLDDGQRSVNPCQRSARCISREDLAAE